MKKWIVAALVLSMLFTACAFAEDSSLNVSGSGTVSVMADQASISIGVTLSGEDIAALQKECNEKVNAVCEALKGAGVAEDALSTNYISIYPQYDYSGETQKLTGYQISNSIQLKTGQVDQIGAYIDLAFQAGANEFDSISFSLKDDSEARRQALTLAVQDARAKAETIAAAAGMKLGELQSITEDGAVSARSANTSSGIRSYEAADMAGSTQVYAAQITVSAGVSASYEMK